MSTFQMDQAREIIAGINAGQFVKILPLFELLGKSLGSRTRLSTLVFSRLNDPKKFIDYLINDKPDYAKYIPVIFRSFAICKAHPTLIKYPIQTIKELEVCVRNDIPYSLDTINQRWNAKSASIAYSISKDVELMIEILEVALLITDVTTMPEKHIAPFLEALLIDESCHCVVREFLQRFSDKRDGINYSVFEHSEAAILFVSEWNIPVKYCVKRTVRFTEDAPKIQRI